MKKFFNTTSISYIALFIAFLAILGGISIPIGPISITLGSLGVYLVSSLLSTPYAVVTIGLYILMGALGLPVFSNFEGGIAKLLGPTGGYILGFLLCAFVESFLISKFKNKKWIFPISMLIGTLVIYLFGTLWFLVIANGKYDFWQILMICVIPFIPLDLVKIVIASLVGMRFRKYIDKELDIN